VTDDRPDAGTGPGATNGAAASPPAAPAEAAPLNAIALAKEVVLERMQNLLEWLLRRLKRYRAGRGNWWET
jgi:hypothetical protein